MASNLISVTATSLGGACGKSLKLELKNNTHTQLSVSIDPALIFRAQTDTSMQDLVVLGNEVLVLAPDTVRSIDLQTFCGKSYGRCPSAAQRYQYWRQGDSDMIRTLCYVKANGISMHLAQKAVWTFTNRHCINSIYSCEQSRMSEEFAKYVASLRKSKMPEFFIDYKLDNTAGRPMMVADRSKVYANMHWAADEGYRHMRLTIYNAAGGIYKQIEADQVIDKYGHTVKVEFDPNKDPKGIYLVVLHDDANKVWDKKRVMVGTIGCDMVL